MNDFKGQLQYQIENSLTERRSPKHRINVLKSVLIH